MLVQQAKAPEGMETWNQQLSTKHKESELEQLESFFVTFAASRGFNLLMRTQDRAFALRQIREGREQQDAWITVNLANTSSQAVKLDSNCCIRQLHEVLTRMKVPHIYETQHPEEGLRMSVTSAKHYLSHAYERIFSNSGTWKEKSREENGTTNDQSPLR